MSEKTNCDSCALGLPVGGLNVCTIKPKGKRVMKLTDVCSKWKHWSEMFKVVPIRAKPIKRKPSAPKTVKERSQFNRNYVPHTKKKVAA